MIPSSYRHAQEPCGPKNQQPSFYIGLALWLRLGLASFGGPSSQIALMHDEVVERRQWVSHGEFTRGLNLCMLLPGPEAQQLATYLGWKLHGVLGGLAAGALFVLPGALVVCLLAWLYATSGDLHAVQSAFLLVRASIVGIVVVALHRLASRTLKTKLSLALAVASTPVVLSGAVSLPALLIFCGCVSALSSPATPALQDMEASLVSPPRRVIGTLLIAWLLPLAVSLATLGYEHPISYAGVLAAKIAVITFGGAYAAIPYLSHELVTTRGWVTPTQMMDALAFVEVSPGPLVLILEFAAFLSAYAHSSVPQAHVSGLVAAGLVVWTLFVPSYVWIFALAPLSDRLVHNPRIAGFMQGLGAAATGAIAALALWLAGHTIVRGSVVDPVQLLSALVAGVLVWRRIASPITVTLAAAVLSLLWVAVSS
jgi:chromate transporter